MQSAIKNYFAITKKEGNGMLILVALILIVLLAPDIYQLLRKPEVVDFSKIKEAQKILDQAVEEQPNDYKKSYLSNNQANASFNSIKLKAEYFTFNPNQLPEALWKRLGLSERQIKVIQNYESKGGRFYKKEDLQKIYSITPEDYARLASYIEIPERSLNKKFSNYTSAFKVKPLIVVEINQADSAQLTEIKGIGPAFANRIMKYRSRLGGFYRKTQLMEVYGLDSIKYEEISKQVEIDASEVIKININTCDFDALKRNPYLSFKQMNAIIQYRKQHGNYKSSSDLKNVTILNEEIIQKLEPYLSY
ncbi:MAG: helix-hairpin-helix domain-containing protein [Janthinobacterium lividum]